MDAAVGCARAHIDEVGEVAVLQVEQHRRLVQHRQRGHVLGLIRKAERAGA